MKINSTKIMLHKLRYGAFSKIWPCFSYGLVWLFGPRLAAYLTVQTIDWGPKGNGPIVLCLFRESFIKDIHEMRKRTDMQFAVVLGGFTRFQKVWFPEQMQTQTFYQSYLGPGRERALAMSAKYAQYIMTYVERKRHITAVLSANFDYWQEVGFKNICTDNSIPFIVLSREHPVVPSVCDVVTEWYVRSAYKFEGRLIAVAGDSSKNVLSRISTVCDENQVVVTGLPRFDAWRDVNCSLPLEKRKYITLLTFTEGYFADKTFKDVLGVFLHAARNNKESGLRYFIKTKDAHDQHLIQNLISEADKLFVECSHEEDLFRILPLSRCVIGYNSLSMVEAIMAGSRLVIPAWGECLAAGPSVMYSIEDPVVSSLVSFALSPEHLLHELETDNCIRKTSKKEIDAFVSKFIYIPENSTSSQKVVDAIQYCCHE